MDPLHQFSQSAPDPIFPNIRRIVPDAKNLMCESSLRRVSRSGLMSRRLINLDLRRCRPPGFIDVDNVIHRSRQILRLRRTLSTLAHWSAIFGETKYLPLLTFPFVKLFQNNQLICFEVVATVITNWCQHWFEYFPNPPINILGMVENVLAHHDKELLQHFVKYDVTSQVYAWPLLETLFSEVLTREEWLKLFDNVFSNHPSFPADGGCVLYLVLSFPITALQPEGRL
ncbi:unnamed protein product [Ranitomeya imitator]|uniref:Rab-GAP TBC domain-containing protein n=1 Tax=Ranitomeya imitator TaxID=111125 RepID=A0ABN9LFU6_9NEOB|nr:unnamed protein product [Ranitomeya imitator]